MLPVVGSEPETSLLQGILTDLRYPDIYWWHTAKTSCEWPLNHIGLRKHLLQMGWCMGTSFVCSYVPWPLGFGTLKPAKINVDCTIEAVLVTVVIVNQI